MVGYSTQMNTDTNLDHVVSSNNKDVWLSVSIQFIIFDLKLILSMLVGLGQVSSDNTHHAIVPKSHFHPNSTNPHSPGFISGCIL